ncbi:MAG: hypothetical protein M3Y21_04710 [Candidatus Eremiobacteraeota bacterium]|nr:hypothetical protein [Candidatus Eremiobacteraeota bacterium]
MSDNDWRISVSKHFPSFGKVFGLRDYGERPYTVVPLSVSAAIDFDHRFIKQNGVESTRKMVVGIMSVILDSFSASSAAGYVSIEDLQFALSRTTGIVAVRSLKLAGREEDIMLPPGIALPCPEIIDLADIRIV